jgi:hypothetical protein
MTFLFFFTLYHCHAALDAASSDFSVHQKNTPLLRQFQEFPTPLKIDFGAAGTVIPAAFIF